MNNMAKRRHLVYLDSKQEDFLNEIVELKNLEALSSTSKLMRFIIEDYYKLITKGTTPDRRLNYISKEVSMILNLVASISHAVKVTHMTNENVVQYWQAEREVERIINENKMRKGYRKKKKPSPSMKAKLEEKTFNESYYDKFGVSFAENNEGLETEQEESKLEFVRPSFLSTYEHKADSDDDYVEVSTDDWGDSKF
jgi:hypothetical protein